MTNEEINRKISEARGYVLYKHPAMGWYRWYIPEPHVYPTNGWSTQAVADAHLPDWCGSEDASAVLRNELKAHFPYFSITFNRDRHKIEFEASGVEGGFAIDIPTDDELEAVAMAYLKWKEHPQ